MKIEIRLFGALGELEPEGRLQLELEEGARVAALREALAAHAAARWPESGARLLARCAFASDSSVLRGPDPLPADGRMAVLPPVSGG